MTRRWAFVVTSPKYLYPLIIFIFLAGIVVSFLTKDPTHLNRVGNFIIGTGVWMSMRYTLREGINRHKTGLAESQTIRGTNQLNPHYFNEIGFSIGDSILQIHGFCLVIFGSLSGSYGDLILRALFSNVFV